MEYGKYTNDRPVTVAAQAQINFQPKVTIIVPVYQVEAYLRECLDSILAQTFQEFEVICVNDGSKDHSLDILMEYASRDSRITVLCQENAGVPAARNTALFRAKGDYIYFMDSDDKLKPHALSVLYEKASKTHADIVYFDATIQAEDPELLKKINYSLNRYVRTHHYPKCVSGIEMRRMMKEYREFRYVVWVQFFRRGFLTDNRLAFFENIKYFEDGIFSELCIISAKTTVCIPDRLYIYRIRPDSIMTMNRTFQHVYGHFMTGLYLARYYTGKPELLKENPWLFDGAQTFITGTKRNYRLLSPEEKAKPFDLTQEEQALFRLFIEHPYMEPDLQLINNAERELKSIRNSVSFKIGRIITWIPRKIRAILRAVHP